MSVDRFELSGPVTRGLVARPHRAPDVHELEPVKSRRECRVPRVDDGLGGAGALRQLCGVLDRLLAIIRRAARRPRRLFGMMINTVSSP